MRKWWGVFVLILSDQLSKTWVLKFYPQLVSFNKGISFGWWESSFWLGVNGLILFYLGKILLKKTSLPLAFIFAGGISNFFDRIRQGGVVDWLEFWFLPWRFNLADIWLSLGVIIFLYRFLGGLSKKHESTNKT